MKKIKFCKFLKILPPLVVLLLLLAPTDAYAFKPFEWIKDAFGSVAEKLVDAGGLAATTASLDDSECPVPIVGASANCLFCPLFEILFNASAAVAAASYRAFKSDLGQLLLIFLAVIIAISILKNVASMGARDAGTILNNIVSRVFVCAALYVIITRDYYNIMNMTILPIIRDGMEFIGLNKGECFLEYTISGVLGTMGAGEDGFEETIPSDIGTLILTAICNIEQKINVLFDYGDWAWCLGTGPAKIILHLIPNPIYLIDGILLYLGGLFFLVGYPWVLADAVLQLGISLALLPFAVVGYAFGATKKYLPKLFSWILNSLFVFIFMSILLTCILDYIGRLLGLVFNIGNYSVFFTDPNLGIAFYGPNMVKVLFILIIGWTYMPMTRELASNFAEGSGLSAAKATGEAFVTKPLEHYTGKAADSVASATGNAALSAAGTVRRLTRSANRNTTRLFAKTFGSTDANGNKSFKFAGRTYTAETNADGDTILRKERTSSSGRQHITLSDKYSTIYQVLDKDGNLISSRVEFNHSFAKKHLFNEKGEVNVGAMKRLLEESRLGKDPAYRKAIMEQIAIEAAKRKGFNVGSYFNSRRVIFDPNNPHKISIQQVDHSGSVTSISLDVDERTGQTAFGFSQDLTDTNPFHKAERKTKLKMHKLFLNKFGSASLAGNLAFTTWLGTRYEMRRDATTGEEYYVRDRKKYWFFGPHEVKEFRADGTLRHIQKSASAQAKHAREAADIATKLNGATERKTLFHTYGSYVDAHGNTVYTKKLRAGWNAKNYFRITKGAASAITGNAFKSIPQGILKLSASTVKNLAIPGAIVAAAFVSMPIAAGGAVAYGLFNRKKIARFVRNPSNTWANIKNRTRSILNPIANDWTNAFSGSFQTGDTEHYTTTGKMVTDSLTGQVASTSFLDYTVEKNLDGEKTVHDNLAANTISSNVKQKKHRKVVYFNNGVVEIKTSGEVDNFGNILKEETKFKYSDAAQYGHDSIVSSDDAYQIVDTQGHISNRLQPTLTNGDPNPLNLTFGMDTIASTTVIGGQPTKDFVVHNILKEGRRRKTNKMKTRFLNSI